LGVKKPVWYIKQSSPSRGGGESGIYGDSKGNEIEGKVTGLVHEGIIAKLRSTWNDKNKKHKKRRRMVVLKH